MFTALVRALTYPVREGWLDPKLTGGAKLAVVPLFLTALSFLYGSGEPLSLGPEPLVLLETAVLWCLEMLCLGYQVGVYREVIPAASSRSPFGDPTVTLSDTESVTVLFGLCFGAPLLYALLTPFSVPPLRVILFPTELGGLMAGASGPTLAVLAVGVAGGFAFPATICLLAATDSLRGALDPRRLWPVFTSRAYLAYWTLGAVVSGAGAVGVAWLLYLAGVLILVPPLWPGIVLLGLTACYVATYVAMVVSWLLAHGYVRADASHQQATTELD